MPKINTGQFKKGQRAWNKGKSNFWAIGNKHRKGMTSPMKGKKHTPEAIEKMRLAKLGKPLSEEHGNNISKALKGRKLTPEWKAKIAKSNRGKLHNYPINPARDKKRGMLMMGSKNRFWKGGRMQNYTEIERIRRSAEYRQWRKAVYKRDDYTCQMCGQWGGKLNADHIKRFSDYPELRFEINNGRTLCVECHRQTDTYGGRANKKEVVCQA